MGGGIRRLWRRQHPPTFESTDYRFRCRSIGRVSPATQEEVTPNMTTQLATKDLTAYMKEVATLESNLYTTQAAIADLKGRLEGRMSEAGAWRSGYRTQLEKVEAGKPKQNYIPSVDEIRAQSKTPVEAKGQEPKETYTAQMMLASYGKGGGFAFLGMGIVVLLLGYAVGMKGVGVVAGGLCIACGVAILVSLMGSDQSAKEPSSPQPSIEAARAEQERLSAIEQERYTNEMAKWNSKHDRAVSQVVKAEASIAELTATEKETRKILDEYYAMDIIFPKYRTLEATCTMYEYLVSGRVTELEGPDGAYNLYESEIRQNAIISKLDEISDQLEDVKRNQYMLYMAIQETNELLGGISNSLSQIAGTSNITAYCSGVTARNAEAVKYLTLIRG